MAVDESIRRRLAIALDVDDLIAAQRLARRLAPWFGIAKVGLELYSASGPDAIVSLGDRGFDVFCDVKLHDIPNTVERAGRVLGAVGARYVTLHTAGGVDMVRAGVEGLRQGAAAGGWGEPTGLGVTVLTSEGQAPPERLERAVATAVAGGCGGVVCAAADLSVVRGAASGILTVVPGIRPAGADRHDQGRVATPADAIAAGADILVIGRSVTAAVDPEAAAAAIADEFAGAVTS
jgi:orotidine-5'-phosphate decarboxylase